MTSSEQKRAAKRFAETWRGKGYEKGESQLFWIELLRTVFGVDNPEHFIVFENPAELAHTNFIDARIPATEVLIEQKSLGVDLNAKQKQSDGTMITPMEQAQRYVLGLKRSEHPRFIVVCNFATFQIYDTEERKTELLQLSDLPEEYYRLSFLTDMRSVHLKREMRLSLQAGQLVALHGIATQNYRYNPERTYTPFFSFVVPCCDVEPYIEKCLDSVLNQSFQNWECILGIETSKDRTEEIIREKTDGDPRFRIFTGPRTGSCSVTRNTGIDLARGEYIIFLDGDDTIADGCLERLHEKICANPGADLYPCAIIANNEITGERERRDNYREDAPEMTGVEAMLHLNWRLRGGFCPMLQLTVHRREFLVEHDLKCIPGLRHQDAEFSPRALYLAKRVVPLHEPFYLYRIRPDSVQTRAKGADYFMKDWAVITKSLLAFYGKVSREDGFDARVVPCWIRQWFSEKRMNFLWFFPERVREIPREKRAEWLKFIFEDGFDSYDSMMKYGTCPQRIAAFHVRLFVRCPALRWYAELFFRIYFMFTGKYRVQTNEGLSVSIPPEPGENDRATSADA